MTLGDFFRICAENPSIILFYFIAVPLTALLALVFGKGDGHRSPWKYLYAVLVYLACVPGIFAFTLNVYLFLFEQSSIMDTNLYTQILPIVSMIVTIILIRRNVSLDDVPGFDKLWGLLVLILVLLTLMWVLDSARIIVFTFIPLLWVVVILVVLFVIARLAMRKIAR
jgi:hypothetical protein